MPVTTIENGPRSEPVSRRDAVGRMLGLTGAALVPGILGTARFAGAAGAGGHPLLPAMRYARRGLQALSNVKDYTARFVKTEVVGSETHSSTMLAKFREEPFSVYLKFVQPYAGREVLYVEGENNGNLLAHEGAGIKSLVGTIALEPTSSRAMEGNRYPVTMFGMKKMLLSLLSQWKRETSLPAGQVKYFPKARIGDLPCKVIQSTQPEPGDGIQFHVTRLFMHDGNNLPLRVQQYGFPAGGEKPLLEDYTYFDVKTNVGLTNEDFDQSNSRYAF